MAALNPQVLIAEANCYACFGISVTDLLKLSLLDRISQTAPVALFVERAGITDTLQIAALNSLFISANAHGWWQKCDLIYPFVGGTALSHSQNFKSSSFTITWAGTVTHDANGITGNGVDGYGTTGYIPSTSGQITLNSAHIGIYRRTVGSNTRGYVSSVLPGLRLQLNKGASANEVDVAVNSLAGGVILTVLAFIAISRSDAVNIHIYSSTDFSPPLASVSTPGIEPYILANNNNGTPGQYSNANLAAVTVGSGITFSEYQLMAADWQAFQTALGRQL